MSRQPGPTDSGTTHVSAVHTPNGAASPPTTTRVAGHTIPAGGTTAKEAHREGSHFQPPPQIKLPPWVVQVHRTTEDLTREGREAAADPSVAQEACRRKRVCSCHVRRVICPPDQCQVFHHQWHLKEPSLSGEVGQGPPSMTPHDWWQNFTVVVERRTWSMCSGSITSLTLPPSRRWNGRGSRSSFLNTSSSIRRKPWASKNDAQWILWPTSKTLFIRPLASTWMASGVSPAG